jgi:O-methyltransferase
MGMRGISGGELIDAVSASPLGRALDPLAHVLRRRQALTLGHEAVRILTQTFHYARSEMIDGDYAEFGIWTGRTFVEAWRIAAGLGEAGPRRFFAFDSFEGLPTAEGIDDTGRWQPGEFTYPRTGFEARMHRARIPKDHVHIVQGFYDDTLSRPAEIPLDKVAVAWIDCDLYSSTVPVLDYLTPRLSQGAVVLFDDWFCFKADPELGEQRACHEWLEHNPAITLVPWRQFNWAGQAFIVRRTDQGAPNEQASA